MLPKYIVTSLLNPTHSTWRW